jgi:hypothetical protein
MCEHCRTCGVVSVEKYDAEDGELCEFIEDLDQPENCEEDLPMCENRAEHLMVETTVEDHLCSTHVERIQTEEVDADLFAESIGLGSSTIVPIEGKYSGPCQYFDPLDPKLEQCTEQATHARILEFETLYCEEHLKQHQEELKS